MNCADRSVLIWMFIDRVFWFLNVRYPRMIHQAKTIKSRTPILGVGSGPINGVYVAVNAPERLPALAAAIRARCVGMEAKAQKVIAAV